MAKNVLITGASGFIGSFLVEEALEAGFQVFAGVRPTSSRQYLTQPGIHFIELNLSSENELIETFAEFQRQHGALDFVIHNAGVTQARTKDEFYEVNFRYTQNLIQALQKSHVPITKFILISTLATYGPGRADTFAPIQEQDEEKPVSTYARSKQMADRYVRSIENFPYLILKPTAVFGPRDQDFFRLYKMIQSGFEFSIGSHRQLISLIYVKDFTRVVIGMLLNSVNRKTFFVSDGMGYTKDELNEAIRTALKKKTVRLAVPVSFLRGIVKANEALHAWRGRLPFLNTEKLNEIAAANWLCNSDEVWQELNFRPQYGLPQALDETVRWMKQNRWLR
ncbi:MAG: NAD(P)-dependent oxidoreductase [Bacteroidetes bacterium]|nr:NAD(P)-dependent oxidoreductase [Bacteroidota bacterium]MBS1539621.1 NAD(P)-dependent oxidoreductase [Bacteroidota bacterium]